MEAYIACFDILGFKEFIENYDEEYVRKRMPHYIFFASELAVSNNGEIQSKFGSKPDVNNATISCLLVSDNIILWTPNISKTSFIALIKACSIFLETVYLPVRVCVVRGSIADFSPFQNKNSNGIVFQNSFLYGKGIVDAYLKAERQDWLGCYVDKSAIDSVENEVISNLIEENIIIYYAVPFKDGTKSYEHVIRVVKGNLTDSSFRDFAKRIEIIFQNPLKKDTPLTESVKRKMNNTIKFLEFFRLESSTTKE